MPYIELKTNKHLEDNIKQEINKLFDKNISIFKGKTKEWLMVNILDNLNLHFQGNDDECLIIEVKIYKEVNRSSLDEFSLKITKAISKLTSIKENRIYINYLFIDNWGYEGYNF